MSHISKGIFNFLDTTNSFNLGDFKNDGIGLAVSPKSNFLYNLSFF